MKKGVCKYFNGIQHEECDKAVNYRKLAGNDTKGMALRLPCIGSHKTIIVCNEMKWPTEQEVKDHEEAFMARLEKMRSAFENIPDLKAKHPNGGSGQIECPACKGILRYSIARANNHIHMKCSTEGCISMME